MMTDAQPLNLGQFIDALERVGKMYDGSTPYVAFRFGDAVPDGFTSYRGYYDDLALTFKSDGSCRVDELLTLCRAANGETFEGYKGGSYRMTRNTELHVAGYGRTSNTRIVGVSWELDDVVSYIETAEIED